MSAYTPRASLSVGGNRGFAAIVLTDTAAQLCAALFDRPGYPAPRCTFRPAFTPGIMPFSASQAWNSFTYVWETNNFQGSIAGTDFDQIAILGSLDLAGGAGAYLLDITSLTAMNVAGDVGNFSEANRTWKILTTTDGITGFNSSQWTISTMNFTSSPGATGAWSLDKVNNDLVLSYVIVPEPKAIVLAVIGVAAGASLFRRRK